MDLVDRSDRILGERHSVVLDPDSGVILLQRSPGDVHTQIAGWLHLQRFTSVPYLVRLGRLCFALRAFSRLGALLPD